MTIRQEILTLKPSHACGYKNLLHGVTEEALSLLDLAGTFLICCHTFHELFSGKEKNLTRACDEARYGQLEFLLDPSRVIDKVIAEQKFARDSQPLSLKESANVTLVWKSH